MSVEVQILKSRNEFRDLKRQIDMSRAYRAITAELGPSEQLLKFIDHDGKLGEEIGFGLESLSTQAKHEILLSKLDDGKLSEVALESLGTTLKRFGRFLAREPEVGFLLLGGIAISAVIAGSIVETYLNRNKVNTYAYFTLYKKEFERDFSVDSLILQKMPTTFDEDKWKAFYDYLSNGLHLEEASHKDETTQYDFVHNRPMVPYQESGWTKEHLVAEARYLEERSKELQALKRKSALRVHSIESWLDYQEAKTEAHEETVVSNNDGDMVVARKTHRTGSMHDVHWYVSECISLWWADFYGAQRCMDQMHSQLNRVARIFAKAK